MHRPCEVDLGRLAPRILACDSHGRRIVVVVKPGSAATRITAEHRLRFLIIRARVLKFPAVASHSPISLPKCGCRTESSATRRCGRRASAAGWSRTITGPRSRPPACTSARCGDNPSYRLISDNARGRAALSEAERFAIESGPEFVDVDGDYPRLPTNPVGACPSGST